MQNRRWHRKCLWAVQNGQVKCSQYVIKHGCPSDAAKLCRGLGWSEDARCLKWLHKHVLMCINLLPYPLPLDENSCNNAAYFGHLSCLQYAHKTVVVGACIQPITQQLQDTWTA